MPRVAPRIMLTTMARQVAVIGSGAEWESAAEEVGRLLAERGCTVITGGLGEVMAAAHRGAKSAGGTTIAILPGEDRTAANPWADHVVVTGDRPRAEPGRGRDGRRRDRDRRELRHARRDGARASARSSGGRARRRTGGRRSSPCHESGRRGRARSTSPRLDAARGNGSPTRSSPAPAPAGRSSRPRHGVRDGDRDPPARRGRGGTRRALRCSPAGRGHPRDRPRAQ